MKAGWLLLGALAVAGCTGQLPSAREPPPRYMVGAPYQAGGVWRYPRERFDLLETGLAVIAPARSGLTANGEASDPAAMAAGHPTLQLPAIARVTNLENGRFVLVRINDRGPPAPGRVIELTSRAAALLGATAAPFQVRVELLEAESRALAAAMAPPPALGLATAPRGAVESEALAPPVGAHAGERAAAQGRSATVATPARVAALAAPDAVAGRLPEQVWQGVPAPGALYVLCGSFNGLTYARIMQSRLASLGAGIATGRIIPGDRPYQVWIGPLADIAAADAALDRVLRAGISDARIVVDSR